MYFRGAKIEAGRSNVAAMPQRHWGRCLLLFTYACFACQFFPSQHKKPGSYSSVVVCHIFFPSLRPLALPCTPRHVRLAGHHLPYTRYRLKALHYCYRSPCYSATLPSHAAWRRSFTKEEATCRRCRDSKLPRIWMSRPFLPPYVLEAWHVVTATGCRHYCRHTVRHAIFVTSFHQDGRVMAQYIYIYWLFSMMMFRVGRDSFECYIRASVSPPSACYQRQSRRLQHYSFRHIEHTSRWLKAFSPSRWLIAGSGIPRRIYSA